MPSHLRPSISIESNADSIITVDSPPSSRHHDISVGRRAHESDADRKARIIRKATRDELKEHKNDAFLSLSNAYKDLNKQHTALRLTNDKLSLALAEMATQSTGRAAPLQSASAQQVSVFATVVLKQDCPPGIQFWDEASFHNRPGKGILDPTISDRSSKDRIPSSMEYVEKDDGTTVTANELRAIRALARRLVQDMENGVRGMKHPGTWRHAGTLEVEHLYSGMYNVYPFLRWCRDHWKVRSLASETMSGGNNAEGKRKKRHDEKLAKEAVIKTEATNAAVITKTVPPPSPTPSSPIPAPKIQHRKRKNKDSTSQAPPPKKVKTASDPSTAMEGGSTPEEEATALSDSSTRGDRASLSKRKERDDDTDNVPAPKKKAKSHKTNKSPTVGAEVTVDSSSAAEESSSQSNAPTEKQTTPPPPSPTRDDTEHQESHLATVFGEPKAPAGRREAFKTLPAPAQSEVPTAKMRRVTRGFDPLNLYYIDYKQEHGPTTEAEFAKVWDNLSAETRKTYEDRGAELKKNGSKKKTKPAAPSA